MSALANKRWTVEEYLAFERDSDEKHEFIDGNVYLMTGASREHNLIVFSLATILGNQLRGRACEAYANDMRVKVRRQDYTYPDVTVVCHPPEFEDADVDTLLNPTLLIEVLSPSTEQYDRGKKFETYRTLKSLQEYVLIAQDRPHVEHYVRQDQGMWMFSEVNGLDASLELTSIGCALTLADIYEKVTFAD
ncbi:MAG: Uma2 family endonuclease [Anaerolineae bacterium]|nr:Uma2 family endonuclease [Anaerolineae bacterium]